MSKYRRGWHLDTAQDSEFLTVPDGSEAQVVPTPAGTLGRHWPRTGSQDVGLRLVTDGKSCFNRKTKTERSTSGAISVFVLERTHDDAARHCPDPS